MMRKTNMQRARRRQPSSPRKDGRRPECARHDSGDRRTNKQSRPAYKRKPLRIPTDAEQAELLQLAIEKQFMVRGVKRLALRQELREREHVFSKSHARHLHALNPYSGAKWAEIVSHALAEVGATKDLWSVTIIDDDWQFSTYPFGPTERDLRWMLSRMRKSVQRRLRGLSYFLQADFAVRRYVVNNRLAIEVHWHGLVWGTEEQINARVQQFPANRYGAAGMAVERVYDLAGVLGYAMKDTRLGYSTVKNFGFQPGSRNWMEWFPNREALSASKRWLLIAMLGDLRKPELCAASGLGFTVLRKARRMAKAQARGVQGFPARTKLAPRVQRRR